MSQEHKSALAGFVSQLGQRRTSSLQVITDLPAGDPAMAELVTQVRMALRAGGDRFSELIVSPPIVISRCSGHECALEISRAMWHGGEDRPRVVIIHVSRSDAPPFASGGAVSIWLLKRSNLLLIGEKGGLPWTFAVEDLEEAYEYPCELWGFSLRDAIPSILARILGGNGIGSLTSVDRAATAINLMNTNRPGSRTRRSPRSRVTSVHGTVLKCDSFGNLTTSIACEADELKRGHWNGNLRVCVGNTWVRASCYDSRHHREGAVVVALADFGMRWSDKPIKYWLQVMRLGPSPVFAGRVIRPGDEIIIDNKPAGLWERLYGPPDQGVRFSHCPAPGPC